MRKCIIVLCIGVMIVLIIGLSAGCETEDQSKIEIIENAKDFPQVYSDPEKPSVSNITILSNPFYVNSGADKGKKVSVYDGTIEKYNGIYYLIGTGSIGKVYQSRDMVHWDSPYTLITNGMSTLPPWTRDGKTYMYYSADKFPTFNAGDLLFHNGVMFFVFNGMGLAHGNPKSINTVPDFKHSFWDKPYDKGIDPQLFVAHNGDLVYIRKVNPNEPDPNTGAPKLGDSGAWMWKVNSFFNEEMNPGRSIGKKLINTQPGHWANIDHLNFEGPEMYYHNGQYYLLYVGNCMDARTGLYDTGVAQADHYDQFDNSTKYPGKMISRNIERLILKYNVILPTAEHGSQTYEYTFTEPEAAWSGAEYTPAGWNKGEGGFGYPPVARNTRIPSINNNGETNPSKIWGSPNGPENIWVRREFHLQSIPDTVVLRHRLEGNGTLYINGKEIYSQKGRQSGYKMTRVPADVLQVGKNVIAAKGSRVENLEYYNLDFGLYDTKGEPVEADIVGPSQPNVIKGPNGFEIWATFKAFWDGLEGQGKDRVYFWDDEMVVDGPTSASSPGLHLDASQPSFSDAFDSEASLAAYTSIPGGVSLKEQSLYFNSPNDLKEVLLKELEITNFFMETNIRFDYDFGNQSRAGLTVWYKDDNNYVRIYIHRKENQLIVSYKTNGHIASKEYALPSTFKFLENDDRVSHYGEQFHTLKVYKNGATLFAELDHYKLNNDQPVLELAEMSNPGRVGLVSLESKCRMDNVTVTRGWSEYDSGFIGWNNSWTVTGNGLKSPAAGQQLAVKGDPMLEYEFSAHIDTGTLPESGKAGFIPAYLDEQNYLAAYTSYDSKKYELHKVVNGKEELLISEPTGRDTIYGHSNYMGARQKEYIYDLRGTVEVSRADILWFFGPYKYMNQNFRLPEASSTSLGFDTWNSSTGSWEPVQYGYTDRGIGDYHIADFTTSLKTDKIRLKVPKDNNRPFSFAVREEISSKNFYKTTRINGRVYLWVNNELIFDVDDPFYGKAAQTGFFTSDCEAVYDSVTCFEVNNKPKNK